VQAWMLGLPRAEERDRVATAAFVVASDPDDCPPTELSFAKAERARLRRSKPKRNQSQGDEEDQPYGDAAEDGSDGSRSRPSDGGNG
jgi:hypothetical protein